MSQALLIINFYLFLREGKSFIKNYKKIGASGILGGISLGIAMMCFIWSITHTTVAITLLMLAAMPFMTAILGYVFLKEKVSNTTFNSNNCCCHAGIFLWLSTSREIVYLVYNWTFNGIRVFVSIRWIF